MAYKKTSPTFKGAIVKKSTFELFSQEWNALKQGLLKGGMEGF